VREDDQVSATTSDDTGAMRVGFIGVGGLGSALLGRELDCGIAVTAFDARPEATVPFAGRAALASSPAQVASTSSVVQVVVNDDSQVLDALVGDDGVFATAEAGLVVLIHSTISHETLRTVLAHAEPKGVIVLDAPVSGAMGVHSIPDMCVMVGGDPVAYATVEPLLRSFASLVLYLGSNGRGLDAKLARNAIGYLFYLINLEGLRLADAAGIERETMWRILDHTGLDGIRGGMAGRPTLREEDPTSWPSQTAWHMTAVAQKDLRAALARAAELDVMMPTTSAAVDRMPEVFGADILGSRR
jgi:3-hydroxyisobutyrate dehydrogenase